MPKGLLRIIIIDIEPYSVIEYEGAAVRRVAKEHAATRIFGTQ